MWEKIKQPRTPANNLSFFLRMKLDVSLNKAGLQTSFKDLTNKEGDLKIAFSNSEVIPFVKKAIEVAKLYFEFESKEDSNTFIFKNLKELPC